MNPALEFFNDMTSSNCNVRVFKGTIHSPPSDVSEEEEVIFPICEIVFTLSRKKSQRTYIR